MKDQALMRCPHTVLRVPKASCCHREFSVHEDRQQVSPQDSGAGELTGTRASASLPHPNRDSASPLPSRVPPNACPNTAPRPQQRHSPSNSLLQPPSGNGSPGQASRIERSSPKTKRLEPGRGSLSDPDTASSAAPSASLPPALWLIALSLAKHPPYSNN